MLTTNTPERRQLCRLGAFFVTFLTLNLLYTFFVVGCIVYFEQVNVCYDIINKSKSSSSTIVCWFLYLAF